MTSRGHQVDLTGRTILMLVWTGVATDTRVLREATTLVSAGARVHIIGRAVPADFVPPDGVTVDSAGQAPSAATRRRELTAPERLARWALLPIHVRRRYTAWQREATTLAFDWSSQHEVAPDVVHAHDFTALSVGHALAESWGVPLVYDTHEYWVGRPVEGRPAPLIRRSEASSEDALVRDAAAVITVGDGVAGALRADHPTWPEVTVVRNTFPLRADLPAIDQADPPRRLVYGGRLAAYRELEVIAAASERSALPITALGPADEEWLRTFDARAIEVLPAEPLTALDARLREAGAALVTHSDTWLNHRLAMPNKLFHAVSLGLPVVATDVGDLGALVRRHGLGTLYAPGDADGLVRAIDELLAHHSTFVAAAAAARASLSWSADSDALLGVYAGVL
ncbi:Glycosyl transferase, group 1 [Janibacter sp. HTCC2649]|uniref:glycosyltransferase n=1 Tax=Janibacter sp. HTCC2649 TaxID=313589 RepID=UPI0000670F10|nr:glycosyltransferase [Janibacter sp. HTCC2649]EAP97490.1 Glycosyl transferase, group 1 [Janibacter sp. HTCC2649]